MSATIIDGAVIAEQMKADVRARVDELNRRGKRVHLAAVLVGATSAGELYAQRQGEACRAVGIDYALHHLPAETTQSQLKQHVRALNADAAVTGIMVHLPLPSHIRAARVQYEIDVVKDVEGVNPANIGYVVYGQTLIAPCTALSVIELIRHAHVPMRGAEAVV